MLELENDLNVNVIWK